MTTIAANRSQIAGDRCATHSGGFRFKIKSKLYTFNSPLIYPHPFHVGMAGNIESFPDIIDFFTNPAEAKKIPRLKGGEGIILTENGKLFCFSIPTIWVEVDQEYYAVGSGANFAMGAMAAGDTPEDAIKKAMRHDTGTAFGVTKINR